MQERLKGSSSKISINFPNAIKLYDSKIGLVDLMDQLKSAYQLDRRSKFPFYLRFFFDMFNFFIVYKKLENKDLTLKEFKIDHFFRQPKNIFSGSSPIQVHQSSKSRSGTPVTFANFLGGKTTMYCILPSKKRKQSICYVFIMWCSPLPSKRKKLLF